VVGEIESRGRVPVFCGGTGLYFKALLDGLGEAPPAEANLRAELEAMPLADLLTELEQRDAETYAKIDRQNPRRVVRAVEVIRLTGKKFSEQRADWNSPSGVASPAPRFFCLIRPATELHERINIRVDRMFSTGLVEETRGLLERGLVHNPTAMQALGYRQVVEHLRGERGLAETNELVKSKTRQFAKRQLTWFRKYAPAEWIELSRSGAVEEFVNRVKGPA
jgi:tRNA dimethylallyltransferase